MNINLPLFSFLPITLSIINLIIGAIFIYFYFTNTHKNLIYLGLCIIFLSLYVFFAGISYLIDNYVFAIWWAKIYYTFLIIAAFFFLMFIYQNILFKPKFLFYVSIGLLILSIPLIFTKFFIPIESCIKDFSGRFVFKKGFLYPLYIVVLYCAFLISAFQLHRAKKTRKEISYIKIDYFIIGIMALLLIGLNDFASIIGIYKTIPLFSYGLLIFNILWLEPFFKNYIVFFKDLNMQYKNTIKIFAKMLETKNPLSYGDAKRVGMYAKYIGKLMNLNKNILEKLELAALLYNIGQIGVPDKLLNKPNLKESELEILNKKLEQGKSIISRMVILYNIKDLINFPEFYKINKEQAVPVQILSIADHINKKSVSSYLENKFDFQQIIMEITNNHFLNGNLIDIIKINHNKIENLILDNLVILKSSCLIYY